MRRLLATGLAVAAVLAAAMPAAAQGPSWEPTQVPLAAATQLSSAAATQPAVEFGVPQASGDFGQPITFQTEFRSGDAPRRVELLASLPGEEGRRVSSAAVEATGPQTWRATVIQGGHVVPNTTYRYRFRVVTDDGAVVGPEASHVVADTRLEWRRLEGEHVTVWWHQGDEAFAERALAIAEAAVASASELLGVRAVAPVDFFVYADSRAFREALGPATRENVGGEAHPYIRTLFGLIEPHQVGSDWVEELVVHELAHLVFDDAVANPYGYPPRWLNEGLASYLAKGYDDGDRAQVAGAARAGTIIPLEGLAGQFPTRPSRFGLAYAESVSAVDHFIDTYGEGRLTELVASFAAGQSLDEAFVAATGAGVRAFEDSWLASVGADRPAPLGPLPGEPAAVPEPWESPVGALLR